MKNADLSFTNLISCHCQTIFSFNFQKFRKSIDQIERKPFINNTKKSLEYFVLAGLIPEQILSTPKFTLWLNADKTI